MRPRNRFVVGRNSYNILSQSDKQVYVRFFWREDAPESVRKINHQVLYNVGEGEEEFDLIEDAVKACIGYSRSLLLSSEKEKVEEWGKATLEYIEKMWPVDRENELLDEKEQIEKRLVSINSELLGLREDKKVRVTV